MAGGSGKSGPEPLPHGCKMVAAGPAIKSTFKAPRQLHLPFFSREQLSLAKRGVSGCPWPQCSLEWGQTCRVGLEQTDTPWAWHIVGLNKTAGVSSPPAGPCQLGGFSVFSFFDYSVFQGYFVQVSGVWRKWLLLLVTVTCPAHGLRGGPPAVPLAGFSFLPPPYSLKTGLLAAVLAALCSHTLSPGAAGLTQAYPCPHPFQSEASLGVLFL